MRLLHIFLISLCPSFIASNIISSDTSDSLTRQLDYYQNEGVTTSNYSGAIKKRNGTASYWWIRSAISDAERYFYLVRSTGAVPSVSFPRKKSSISQG